MPHDILTRAALSSNAGFSAASGLVLAVAPASIADVVGVDAAWVMRVFGIALLGHAAVLWLAIGRGDIERWAKLNLAVIAPYPFAMLAVAAMVTTGSDGRLLVVADGAAIALLAIALTVGLRQSRRPA